MYHKRFVYNVLNYFTIFSLMCCLCAASNDIINPLRSDGFGIFNKIFDNGSVIKDLRGWSLRYHMFLDIAKIVLSMILI